MWDEKWVYLMVVWMVAKRAVLTAVNSVGKKVDTSVDLWETRLVDKLATS